jgi:hypothetical protein
MTDTFVPTAGQVALVEPQQRGRDGLARPCPLIGVVGAPDDILTIMGVSSPNLIDGTDVLVSIFAPEALYRISGSAHWRDAGQLAIEPIHHVERIQRRRWTRYPMRLEVMLAALDGPDEGMAAVGGQTVDVSQGGVRVKTVRLLPAGVDLIVMFTPQDGESLAVRSSVVLADITDGEYEYRLAFDRLDEVDVSRLVTIIGKAPADEGDSS